MSIASSIKLFAKAQLSSFIGGIVDLSIMIFLTEVFGIHYLQSIVIGGIAGAAVNYTINRKWTFESNGDSKRAQLPKFVCVVFGTIFLKSLGTFSLTEFLFLDYKISRLIADAFVAFGFNYTLQRYWVFNSPERETVRP